MEPAVQACIWNGLMLVGLMASLVAVVLVETAYSPS